MCSSVGYNYKDLWFILLQLHPAPCPTTSATCDIFLIQYTVCVSNKLGSYSFTPVCVSHCSSRMRSQSPLASLVVAAVVPSYIYVARADLVTLVCLTLV